MSVYRELLISLNYIAFMENKNKIVWIGIGLIVIALIVVLAVRGNKMPTENTGIPAGETTPESTLDTTGDPVVSTPGTGAATGTAVSVSYQEALVKYADRRLQFNDMCQATPNTVTYKDNSGIMLDNRSNKTRTIKVGTTYTIKPYGFRIITLPDIYLKSSTLLVDCDKSQNVATVLVQE